MNENQLAENLMYYRKKKGLSQEKIAEYLEISRQAVTKWEANTSKPNSNNLIKLAQLFEVAREWGQGKIINARGNFNRKNAMGFYRNICFMYIGIYHSQCINGYF